MHVCMRWHNIIMGEASAAAVVTTSIKMEVHEEKMKSVLKRKNARWISENCFYCIHAYIDFFVDVSRRKNNATIFLFGLFFSNGLGGGFETLIIDKSLFSTVNMYLSMHLGEQVKGRVISCVIYFIGGDMWTVCFAGEVKKILVFNINKIKHFELH